MLGNERSNYLGRNLALALSSNQMPRLKIHQVQRPTVVDLQPAPRHHLLPWSPVDGEVTAPPSAVTSAVLVGRLGRCEGGLKSGGTSAVSSPARGVLLVLTVMLQLSARCGESAGSLVGIVIPGLLGMLTRDPSGFEASARRTLDRRVMAQCVWRALRACGPQVQGKPV
jgi:hypothetical protein